VVIILGCSISFETFFTVHKYITFLNKNNSRHNNIMSIVIYD